MVPRDPLGAYFTYLFIISKKKIQIILAPLKKIKIVPPCYKWLFLFSVQCQ